MNAIEIESGRDASISISDILSPYNCSDIDLTSTDNLPPRLYEVSSADSDKQGALEKEYDIVQCLRGVDFTSEITPLLLEVGISHNGTILQEINFSSESFDTLNQFFTDNTIHRIDFSIEKSITVIDHNSFFIN